MGRERNGALPGHEAHSSIGVEAEILGRTGKKERKKEKGLL